jgi:8-oxo-dGTP diphosphatase
MNSNPQLGVSVDCVVFGYDGDALKVLLIQQKTQNGGALKESEVQMALPGDLVKANETLSECAARVLRELTNLGGIFLKQFHSFGDPNRVRDEKDQKWLETFREFPNKRIITVAYYALVSLHDYSPRASSFAGSIEWIDATKVSHLAFDHNEIFNYAVTTLREQIEKHYIGFELLPKKFTLSQLQHLHELVLDKKFDKRNFRKNVKRMEHVVPLNEKQTGVLHKPAQLFSFNPEAIN